MKIRIMGFLNQEKTKSITIHLDIIKVKVIRMK